MTKEQAIEKLLEVAQGEIGYLEKKNESYLDSLSRNAGDQNFTKYARDLFPSLQGQPWCDMFVDWCFMKAFGAEKAKELLGELNAYTPGSAAAFQRRKQFFATPQRGDQIFFQGSTRINHTGLVYKVTNGRVYTIEGNTSTGAEVIPNGGGVYCKSYDLSNPRIAGYGRPDWSILVESPKRQVLRYSLGWHQEPEGWWYSPDGLGFYQSVWKCIDHHWYYFDAAGYAATGWKEIDGKRYYFEPEGEQACALYRTDPAGAQGVWYVA